MQGGLRPDLTLLLDVPLEVSMARIGQAREKDRFEQEQADFFMRVRGVYLDRAAACPERYAVIDSNRSLDEVRNSIEKCWTDISAVDAANIETSASARAENQTAVPQVKMAVCAKLSA